MPEMHRDFLNVIKRVLDTNIYSLLHLLSE